MTRKTPIEFDETRVDLGDDLLDTKTLQRPSPLGVPDTKSGTDEPGEIAPPEASATSSEEFVINAKILWSEGLVDQAKQTLRRTLVLDRACLPARQLLEEIQKEEIAQILTGADGRKRSRLRSKKSPLDTSETPDEILSNLEKDLGLFSRDPEPFTNEKEKSDFLAQIDSLLMGADPRNRIDFGIAFLEMGLPDLAQIQFEKAATQSETEHQASLLLASCLIAQERFFDALLILDRWVADPSRMPQDKLEVGYLMARAYEGLGRLEDAAIWHQGVVELNPDYRDSRERLQRCGRG